MGGMVCGNGKGKTNWNGVWEGWGGNGNGKTNWNGMGRVQWGRGNGAQWEGFHFSLVFSFFALSLITSDYLADTFGGGTGIG